MFYLLRIWWEQKRRFYMTLPHCNNNSCISRSAQHTVSQYLRYTNPPPPILQPHWMNEDLLFNRTLLHKIFFYFASKYGPISTGANLSKLGVSNQFYPLNRIVEFPDFSNIQCPLFRSLCRDSGRFYCLYVCVTFCAANRPSGFFSLPAEARKTQALNQQAWPLLSSLSSGLLWTPPSAKSSVNLFSNIVRSLVVMWIVASFSLFLSVLQSKISTQYLYMKVCKYIGIF